MSQFPTTIADGRYTLIEPLGVGGMATVFRAMDQRLQVHRAVKILSPDYANRPSLKDRFEAEARTTAKLEHRHIVKVYDVGRSNNIPYIVMELVEGGTLVDWVRAHGRMPPRMAVEAAVQVCGGVGAAHAERVVHRDIKPHNVLVTADGVCRITDFGIARVQDNSDGLTHTGAVFGTWAYMAPEQRNDAKGVDARADVYSVGATLYFMLTATTPMDLYVADRDPKVMEDVHEAVVPVLMRATQYDRGDRFPDVKAMGDALRELLAELPPVPPDTPPLAMPSQPRPSTLNLAEAALSARGVTLMPDAVEGEDGASPTPPSTMVPDTAGSTTRDNNLAALAALAELEAFTGSIDEEDREAEGDRPPPEDGGGSEDEGSFVGLVDTSFPPKAADEAAGLDAAASEYAEGEELLLLDEEVEVAKARWDRLRITALIVLLVLALLVLLQSLNRKLDRLEQRQDELAALETDRGESGSRVVALSPRVEGPPADEGASAGGGGPGPEGAGAEEEGADQGSPEVVGPPTEGVAEGGSAAPVGATPVEAPPPPPKARVTVEGDAEEVWFVSGARVRRGTRLEAGTWTIRARFPARGEVNAGELKVRAGQRVTLRCVEAFARCSAE